MHCGNMVHFEDTDEFYCVCIGMTLPHDCEVEECPGPVDCPYTDLYRDIRNERISALDEEDDSVIMSSFIHPDFKFIVFEGLDHAGKTTQARYLHAYCSALVLPSLSIKNPGQPVAFNIRDFIFLNNLDQQAELALFMADRLQTNYEYVLPALENDQIVIQDRYMASTYAYQLHGRKADPSIFLPIFNSFKVIKPDITFFLSITYDTFLKRQKSKNTEDLEDNDLMSPEMFIDIRDGYKEYFDTHKDELVYYIDANRPVSDVHNDIMGILKYGTLYPPS